MLSRQGATRRVSLALLCAGTLGLAAGCSSTSPRSAGEAAKGSGQAVKVDVRSVPGVGQVLVTGKGYVLYVFEPDHHRTVTCTGACAGTWPPLMESSGADLIGSTGVQQALFGADPIPSAAGSHLRRLAALRLYGRSPAGPGDGPGHRYQWWQMVTVTGPPASCGDRAVSAPRRPFRSLPVSRRDVLFSGGGLAAGAVAVGAGWAASSLTAGRSPDPSVVSDRRSSAR